MAAFHQTKTLRSYDFCSLLEEVQQKLSRELPLGPRAILTAPLEDIHDDTARLAACRRHLRGWEWGFQPEHLLNMNEKHRLERYCSLWAQNVEEKGMCHWQDLICHLGDNPVSQKGWCTWSGASHAIPTLRRSGGMMWAPAFGRQVLLKELYSAMGFCVWPWQAALAGVSPYKVFIGNHPYTKSRQALGNSQHVASVGVFTCCALACTVKVGQ